MKKLILFLLVAFFCGDALFAAHLKGGWIQYRYLGPGSASNTSRYEITVRQYLDCNSTAGQRDPDIYLGIFDGGTNQMVRQLTVLLTSSERTEKVENNPCISQPSPRACYIIDVYRTTVELADNSAGYTFTVQRCCRIAGIANLRTPTDDFGVSYTAKIPGIINGVSYFTNSSPVFAQKDTVVVCYSAPFSLDFSATDSDGDSLSYTFCAGLTGGFNNRNNPADQTGARPNPPTNPPYTEIGYSSGYYGGSPLGSTVGINPLTGIISGIAPAVTGDYAISVCVNEYRSGILISTTKKEIHVTVANCTIAAASLQPAYITCNGTTLTFENQSPSSNIVSYAWDFGVSNLTTDVSTDPRPTYDYLQSGKDSGTYTVKLKVTSTGGCQDSTTAQVKVYPGFNSDFNVQGTCFLNAYQFIDATQSKYGTVNGWRWDFGDTGTTADTARSKDSAWRYSSAQTVNVTLISTNDKGCIDTITRPVTIRDKPQLNLPFRDTLICSIDTLALQVNIGSGTAIWTVQVGPNQSRIMNPASVSPLVFPADTTKYYVSVNDNGCANTDSVTVNVLQFISVDVRDTAICRTDAIHLQPVSHALSYRWTSSTANEIIPGVKFPEVRPLVNTQYHVVANLGKCEAKDSMRVTVEPYPLAAAGPDLIICYGNRVQLSGTIMGSSFSWSPVNSLVNENTLTPTAGPVRTTAYILTATNTTGCLKPRSDTLIVTVIPPLVANAGRDTTIAVNQPLQLEASGGSNYTWTPSTGLSNPNIYNPIAILDDKVDSIIYTVRVSEAGCFAEDQVTVRVFKTGANILVPSAFTPNGDGRNDDVRPFTVGITQLTYFSIYNRWGQLIFTTNQIGKAWDGTFGGVKQPAGTYVYQALGIDFAGNSIYRKGTLVLIR